jgi:hypothetical protein
MHVATTPHFMSAQEQPVFVPSQHEEERAARPVIALQPAPRAPLLADHVGPRFDDLARDLARRIRRRPMASLALAVGVGFALGGALTFRAGRLTLAAAARHVARELLKQLL